MAIDTAAKRRNISGLLAGITSVGVTPDSSKPVAWRQQAGWGYSGVVVGGAAAPAAEDLTVWYDAVPFDPRYKTRYRETSSTGDSLIS